MCVVYAIVALNTERQRRLKPSFNQMKWFNLGLLLLQIAFFILPFFFDLGIPQDPLSYVKAWINLIIHSVLLISYYRDSTEEEAPVTRSLIIHHVSEDSNTIEERLNVVINSMVERKFVVRLFDVRRNLLVEVHRTAKSFEELIDQMYRVLCTDILAKILRRIQTQSIDMEFVEKSLNELLEDSLYRTEALANFFSLTNKEIRKKYFSVFATRKIIIDQLLTDYPSIRFKRKFKNLELLAPSCYVTVTNIPHASLTTGDQFIDLIIWFKDSSSEYVIDLTRLSSMVRSLEIEFRLRESKGSLRGMATTLTTILNEPIYPPDKILMELSNLTISRETELRTWGHQKLFLEFHDEMRHPFITKFNRLMFMRKVCLSTRIISQAKVSRDLEDILIFVEHLRIRKLNDRNFDDVVLPELISYSCIETTQVIDLLNNLVTKTEIFEIFEARLFFELEDYLM